MNPRHLLLPLLLGLAGCGFHLRSALELPPNLGPVKVVSADRYSPLAESLSRSIERAGAQIATVGDVDPAVLDLVAERWGDTPISVDARGRAQEYSLRYATIFEMRTGDGTVIVPRQAIELSRDYISVPTNSEGTESEREILVKELRREMSAAILRRLGAVARGTDGELPSAAPSSDVPAAADAAIEVPMEAPVEAPAEPVEPPAGGGESGDGA